MKYVLLVILAAATPTACTGGKSDSGETDTAAE